MPSETRPPSRQVDDRIHVAVVCRELGGRGSVPSVALRQAYELANHARVSLLSDTFPSRVDERLQRHNITHLDLGFLRRFSHVPREIAFAVAVKRRLFQLQEHGAPLDFTYCHGHALIAIAASSFRRNFGVPCGLVAHGDVLSSAPGTYDWRLTQFYKWAIPRGYAQADLVVALSPHMRERAIACGAVAHKIDVIPNGIALDEIGLGADSPTAIETMETPVTGTTCLKMLFVGTLDRRKGVDVLCRAAKFLKDDSIDFSLTIVGDGPMRRDLERYVAENDLARRVVLHGGVPRQQLGRWYRWADVTCVPSRVDPLPTVVLESLVAGTPVVGSSIGGIPSMIQSGLNGLLVAPERPDLLAAAVTRIYRESELLRRIRQASASSVIPAFSWTRNGEALARAIERTLRANRAQ